MVFYLRIFCLFSVLFSKTFSEPCSNAYPCSACIQIPGCGWCSRLKGSNEGALNSTCMKQSELFLLCEDEKGENPQPDFNVERNDPLEKINNGSPVQLQPQQVSLKVRAGKSSVIEFKFKKAHDYPVDLYYLLDFSYSMRGQKKSLENLGNKLVSEMKQKTSSLQIGFGSFIDKVALPFTQTEPELLKVPCTDCVSAYSYRNHMPLSKDSSLFSPTMKALNMSGNVDSPEGGFDALLQAMVCTDAIKWREGSRRIIVFCTDAPFHIAGDGRLAGVVEPHDGKCHISEDGKEYTHGLILDYPSVSMESIQWKIS